MLSKLYTLSWKDSIGSEKQTETARPGPRFIKNNQLIEWLWKYY